MYVLFSFTGQGTLAYLINKEQVPGKGEMIGWVIDKEGKLRFKDSEFLACPSSIDDSWSIWLSGFDQPNGNKGCVGLSIGTTPSEAPVSCIYSY